jgi:hypothetical protein
MKFKTPIFFILIIVLLLGLFFMFKQKSSSETTQTPQDSQKQDLADESTRSAQTAQPNTYELVVQNKKLTSGPALIKVYEGESVTIKITSDEQEEFHIHGYDNSVELEPDIQATLNFSANLSGRFPYELELSKTELGAIEVQPK